MKNVRDVSKNVLITICQLNFKDEDDPVLKTDALCSSKNCILHNLDYFYVTLYQR